MSKPVRNPPILPRPGHAPEVNALLRYDQEFMSTTFNELLEHATRLNGSLPKNGTEVMSAPLPLMSYTVATLPDATIYEGSLIYVSNETGGKTIAFSDGVRWRRVQDRVIVS